MFNLFGPSVPTIEAEAVKKALDEKQETILLDVRTREECVRGKLPGSINIPLNELSKKVESVLSDKNKEIYVYCLSGSRSIQAVVEMVRQGYTHVSSMKSGLLAWRAKGFPTI